MLIDIVRKINKVEPDTREILLDILNEIEEQRKQFENQVTKVEFNELKEIVKDLAKAQKRTEQRLEELAEAQKKTETRIEELAEAQKRTDARLDSLTEKVEQLAEAQRETEKRMSSLEKKMEELAEAQRKTEEEVRKLSVGLKINREQIGGLSKSVAYALENDAYRKIPEFLKENYGYKLLERIIRTEIENEEINLLAKMEKDGKQFVLVGESVLKLDDKSKIRKLLNKVNIVKENIGGEIVPIIITHFAKKKILDRAKKAGIIVIQSFEW